MKEEKKKDNFEIKFCLFVWVAKMENGEESQSFLQPI